MKSFFTDKADIYRPMRDDDGKTSETLIGTVSGFLKAQSIQQVAQGNGTFGEDYNFTCDGSSDIKEGDKLSIGGQRFTVKGVGSKHAIRINIKVCRLSISNIIQ